MNKKRIFAILLILALLVQPLAPVASAFETQGANDAVSELASMGTRAEGGAVGASSYTPVPGPSMDLAWNVGYTTFIFQPIPTGLMLWEAVEWVIEHNAQLAYWLTRGPGWHLSWEMSLNGSPLLPTRLMDTPTIIPRVVWTYRAGDGPLEVHFHPNNGTNELRIANVWPGDTYADAAAIVVAVPAPAGLVQAGWTDLANRVTAAQALAGVAPGTAWDMNQDVEDLGTAGPRVLFARWVLDLGDCDCEPCDDCSGNVCVDCDCEYCTPCYCEELGCPCEQCPNCTGNLCEDCDCEYCTPCYCGLPGLYLVFYAGGMSQASWADPEGTNPPSTTVRARALSLFPAPGNYYRYFFDHVTVPDNPPHPMSEFLHWAYLTDFTRSPVDGNTRVTGSNALIAVWSEPDREFRIFSGNGSVLHPASVPTQLVSVVVGEPYADVFANLLDVTRDTDYYTRVGGRDYWFDGDYDGANQVGGLVLANAPAAGTGLRYDTRYAHWTPVGERYISNYITFVDPHGPAVNPVANANRTIQETLAVVGHSYEWHATAPRIITPVGTPTAIFEGWYTADGIRYTSAALGNNGYVTADSPRILFARWTIDGNGGLPDGQIVIFRANSGNFTVPGTPTDLVYSAPFGHTYADMIPAPPVPVPFRNLYTFDGWFDAAGNEFDEDEDVTDDAVRIFYAQWTRIAGTGITVTFGAAGGEFLNYGSTPSFNVIEVAPGTTFGEAITQLLATYGAPEWATGEMMFTNQWSLTVGGVALSPAMLMTVIDETYFNNYPIPVVHLYALWVDGNGDPVRWVVFQGNEGTWATGTPVDHRIFPLPATATYDQAIALLANNNPSRTNYDFVGWSSVEVNGVEVTGTDLTVGDVVVLYAIWEFDPYSVEMQEVLFFVTLPNTVLIKDVVQLGLDETYAAAMLAAIAYFTGDLPTGYYIRGWYEIPNVVVNMWDRVEIPPTWRALRADLQPIDETVTQTLVFHGNGGTPLSQIEENFVFGEIYGPRFAAVAVTAPTGTTFGGWFDAAGNEVTALSVADLADGTVRVLYARWTPIDDGETRLAIFSATSYDNDLTGNLGGEPMRYIVIPVGDTTYANVMGIAQGAPINPPAGYIFAYWTDVAGNRVYPTTPIAATPTSPSRFFAAYMPDPNRPADQIIVFIANGGTPYSHTVTVTLTPGLTFAAAMNEALATITHPDGLEAYRWTRQDGVTPVYYDDEIVAESGPIIIVMHWYGEVTGPETRMVYFLDPRGRLTDPFQYYEATLPSLYANAFVDIYPQTAGLYAATAYEFLGWVTADGDAFDPMASIAPGTMPSIFFARWYDIYNGGGPGYGDEILLFFIDPTGRANDAYTQIATVELPSTYFAAMTVAGEEILPLIPGAVVTGYAFQGWFTEPNGGGDEIVLTANVVDTRVFFAHWTRVASGESIFVTFQTTDEGHFPTSGDTDFVVEVPAGSTFGDAIAGLFEQPEWIGALTGVTFTPGQWSLELNGAVVNPLQEILPIHFSTPPSPVVVLYALWDFGPEDTLWFVFQANEGAWADDSTHQIFAEPVFGATYARAIGRLSDDPTRVGYLFLGWSRTVDGGAVAEPFVRNPDTDVTVLYAMWERDPSLARPFTFVYGVSHTPASILVWAEFGDTLQAAINDTPGFVENPVRVGHIFHGWSILPGSSDANDAVSLNTVVEDSDVPAFDTLFAIWEPIQQRVRLMGNGALFLGTAPYIERMLNDGEYLNEAFGLNVTLMDRLTNPNYTFLGWFTLPVGGDRVGTTPNLVSLYPETADITAGDRVIYAQWQRVGGPGEGTQFIIFNSKGGVPTTQYYLAEDLSRTFGDIFATEIDEPTWPAPGATFLNWNTEPDGSGTTILPSHLVSDFASLTGASIVLYAQWDQAERLVFFIAHGAELPFVGTGYVLPGDEAAVVGQSHYLLLAANAPIEPTWADGREFSAWHLRQADGTTVPVPTGLVQPGLGPIFFVAQTVDPAPDTQTIFFIDPSGRLETRIAENVAVPNQYSVALAEIILPHAPGMVEIAGNEYEFLGWFTEPVGGTLIDPMAMIAPTSFVFFAQWYGDDNGGNDDEVQLFFVDPTNRLADHTQTALAILPSTYFAAMTADAANPIDPILPGLVVGGYVFQGWFAEPNGVGPIDLAGDVASSRVFFAHWVFDSSAILTQEVLFTVALPGTNGGHINRHPDRPFNIGESYAEQWFAAIAYLEAHADFPTGYYIRGWVDEFGNVVNPWDTVTVPPTWRVLHAELHPLSDAPTQTVVFHGNGGAPQSEVVSGFVFDEIYGVDFAAVAHPTPPTPGVIFGGWWTTPTPDLDWWSEEVTALSLVEGPSVRVVYARWIPDPAAGETRLAIFSATSRDDISGRLNGDELVKYIVIPAADTTYAGVMAAAYAALTYPVGYEFSHWVDVNGVRVYPPSAITATPTSPSRFFPVWVRDANAPVEQTVVFIANGGTPFSHTETVMIAPSTTVIFEVSMNAALAAITPPAGYVFAGWSGDATLPTDMIDPANGPVHVVVMHWTLDPTATQYVTFRGNGGFFGSGVSYVTVPVLRDQTFEAALNAYLAANSLPMVERNPLSSLGWFTEPVYGAEVDITATVGNPAAANRTIYKQWYDPTAVLPLEQYVIFIANGGRFGLPAQHIYSRSYAYAVGTYASALADMDNAPVVNRDGDWTFIGWFTTPSGEGDQIVPSTPVAGDPVRRVYARWHSDAQTERCVIFDGMGGLPNAQHATALAGETFGEFFARVLVSNGGHVADPTHDTDTFRYWSMLHIGAEVHPDMLIPMGVDPLHLFAQWTDETDHRQNIVFLGNGGTPLHQIGYVAHDETTYAGAFFRLSTMNPVSRPGWTLTGWFTTPADAPYLEVTATTAIIDDATILVDGTLFLYARWTRDNASLPITFLAENADVVAERHQSIVALIDEETYQEAVARHASFVEAPERHGFVFRGWSLAPSVSPDYDANQPLFPLVQMVRENSPTTLWAIWEPIPVLTQRVVLMGNGAVFGAEGPFVYMYVTQGECLHEAFVRHNFPPMSRMSNPNWTWMGWFDLPVNGGVVGDGESLRGETGNVNAPTRTIYAQWMSAGDGNERLQDILFDANGGIWDDNRRTRLYTADPDEVFVDIQGNVGFPNWIPAGGATFLGWNTQADGSGITILPNHVVGQAPLLSNTTLVLYAQWEQAERTVLFIAHGADSPFETAAGYLVFRNDPAQVGVDRYTDLAAEMTPTWPTATGRVFSHWTMNGGAIPAGVVGVGNEIVFVAHWTTETRTIFFVCTDNTVLPTDSAVAHLLVDTYGDLTADPIRDGYIFLGWRAAGEPATPVFDMTTIVDDATPGVLIAVWERIPATELRVRLVATGGAFADGAMETIIYVGVGERIVDAVNAMAPTRAGYTLLGWETLPVGGSPAEDSLYWDVVLTAEMILENQYRDFYAMWDAIAEIVNVHVIFDATHGHFDLAGNPSAFPAGNFDLPETFADALAAVNAIDRIAPAGHTFGGWYTTPLDAVGLLNGELVTPTMAIPGDNPIVVVFARWIADEEAPTREVVFIAPQATAYGFQSVLAIIDEDSIEDVARRISTPTWDNGRVLYGWSFTDGGPALTPAELMAVITGTAPTGDPIELWAVTTNDPAMTQTVIFLTNAPGILPAVQQVERFAGESLNAAIERHIAGGGTFDRGAEIINPGQNFARWNHADGMTAVDGQYNHTPSNFLPLVLVAQWEAETVTYITVQFHGNGGHFWNGVTHEVIEVRVEVGQNIQAVVDVALAARTFEEPTWDGYEFRDWYTTTTTHTVFDLNVVVTAACGPVIPLFAGWDEAPINGGPREHHVIFDINTLAAVHPPSQTWNAYATTVFGPFVDPAASWPTTADLVRWTADPDGRLFLGWNTARNGSGTTILSTHTVGEIAGGNTAVTLYAQWGDAPEPPATRTVRFSAHGAVPPHHAQEWLVVVTTSFDDVMDLYTVPVRDGFEFMGWTTEAGLYDEDDALNATILSDEWYWTDLDGNHRNVTTFYARWRETPETVQITFVGNGGQPAYWPHEVSPSTSFGQARNQWATAPAHVGVVAWVNGEPQPVRADYDFLGWNRLNGTPITAAEWFEPIGTTDVILVAQWQRAGAAVDGVTVTFYGNGTAAYPANQPIFVTPALAVGTPASQARNLWLTEFESTLNGGLNPTRLGYVFSGWRILGTTDMMAPIGAIAWNTPVTEDVTLIAQWTRVATQTVHLLCTQGGTPTLAIRSTVVGGNYAVIADVEVTRTPANTWVFAGWWTAPQGNATAERVYPHSLVEAVNYVSGMRTLYAHWAPHPDTIRTLTFYANGSWFVGDNNPIHRNVENVVLGSPYGDAMNIVGPELVVPDGYEFLGWYTHYTDPRTVISPNAPVVANQLVLYARWRSLSGGNGGEPANVVVVFHGGLHGGHFGGDASNTQVDIFNVAAGTALSAIEPAPATNPVREFLGWSTTRYAATGNVTHVPTDLPANAIFTVHAIWGDEIGNGGDPANVVVVFHGGLHGGHFGGDASNTQVDIFNVAAGTALSAIEPAPATNPAREFLGWSTTRYAAAGNVTHVPTDLPANAIFTVHAIWGDEIGNGGEPVNVVVVFHGGLHGGHFYGDPANTQVDRWGVATGTALSAIEPAPATNPAREFLGWSTTRYAAAGNVTHVPTDLPANAIFTVHAIWGDETGGPTPWIVTFAANSGFFNGNPAITQTVSPSQTAATTIGSILTYAPTQQYRANHTFHGWSTNSNAAVADPLTDTITAATTLYAVWRPTENGDTVRVYFDANGSHFDGLLYVYLYVEVPTTLGALARPTPEARPEHRHIGWALTSTPAEELDLSAPVTGMTVFYAVWECIYCDEIICICPVPYGHIRIQFHVAGGVPNVSVAVNVPWNEGLTFEDVVEMRNERMAGLSLTGVGPWAGMEVADWSLSAYGHTGPANLIPWDKVMDDGGRWGWQGDRRTVSVWPIWPELPPELPEGAALLGFGQSAVNSVAQTLSSRTNGVVSYTENQLVIFQSNGGIFEGTNERVRPAMVSTDGTYQSAFMQISEPTMPGHSFNGWWSDHIGGYPIVDSTPVTDSSVRMIFAQWVRDDGLMQQLVVFRGVGGDPDFQARSLNLNATYAEVMNLGHSASLQPPSRFEYVFQGWFTHPVGGTQVLPGDTVTGGVFDPVFGGERRTLYAQWLPSETWPPDPLQQVVIFDGNGGYRSFQTALVFQTAGATYADATDQTINPTRPGYVFLGWSNEPLAALGPDDPDPSLDLDSLGLTGAHARAFYAVWRVADEDPNNGTITITFHGMNGLPHPQSATVNRPLNNITYGTVMTAADIEQPVHPLGHAFLGWAIEDPIGTPLLGTVLAETVVTLDRDHTLFAIWDTTSGGDDSITITFYGNGGAPDVQVATVLLADIADGIEYGALLIGTNLVNLNATREGYTLLGWSISNPAGAEIFPVAVLTTMEITLEADHRLYARWEQDAATEFPVIFLGTRGTPARQEIEVQLPLAAGLTYAAAIAADGTTIADPICPLDQWLFDGWALTENGAVIDLDMTEITSTVRHYLYAQWSPNPYNPPDGFRVLIFDTDGGRFDSPNYTERRIVVEVGTTLTAAHFPADPAWVIPGEYDFLGWYTARFGNGTRVEEGFVVTAAMNRVTRVFANWDDGAGNNPLTVVFYGVGGAPARQVIWVDGDNIVTFGDVLGAVEPTVREGWTFLRWHSMPIPVGSSFDFPTGAGLTEAVTENSQLVWYAQWEYNGPGEPTELTILFMGNDGAWANDVTYRWAIVELPANYGAAFDQVLPHPTNAPNYFQGWSRAANDDTLVARGTNIAGTHNRVLWAQWSDTPVCNCPECDHCIGNTCDDCECDDCVPCYCDVRVLTFHANATNTSWGTTVTQARDVRFVPGANPASNYGQVMTAADGLTGPAVAAPTRTGYTFLGWFNTSAATGGTRYTAATQMTATSVSSTTTATLYARWTPATTDCNCPECDHCTGNTCDDCECDDCVPCYCDVRVLTFHANATNTSWGTTVTQARDVRFVPGANPASNYGQVMTAADGLTGPAVAVPTRTGYTFLGWFNTSAATGGTRYTAATQMTATSVSSTTTATLYARWTPATTITITFNANGGIWNAGRGNPQTATVPGTTTTYSPAMTAVAPNPTRAGYAFQGWWSAQTGGTQILAGTPLTATSARTLYARWTPAVTFQANGGVWNANRANPQVIPIPAGTTTYGPLFTAVQPNPTRAGFTFAGWWSAQTGGTQILTGTTLTDTSARTLWARWTPTGGGNGGNGGTPFTDRHHAFLIGRPGGIIAPNDSITRAEAATILFRLLSDEYRERYWPTGPNRFTDVGTSQWFNNAISVMANMDIMRGTNAAGTLFEPHRLITREEFAVILVRAVDRGQIQAQSADISIDGLSQDVIGLWSTDYLRLAIDRGWMTGDGSGNFHPARVMTRAEVAASVNRMLGRVHERGPQGQNDTSVARPRMLAADNQHRRIAWNDRNANGQPLVTPNQWFYLYIQEASHSTDFRWTYNGNYVVWENIRTHLDWARLETPTARWNAVSTN